VEAKRTGRAMILGLISLTFQLVYLTPVRAAAEIRAVHCCAVHCQHPHSAAAAAQCCQVQQGAAESAVVSAVSRVEPPRAGSPGAMNFTTDPCTWARVVRGVRWPQPRGAPIFLLDETLRL